MSAVATEVRLISSTELAERSGATYRQIDYWTRVGYLTPAVASSGSGSYRKFSEADVDRVRAMAAVSGTHLSSLLHTVATTEPPWAFEFGGVRMTITVEEPMRPIPIEDFGSPEGVVAACDGLDETGGSGLE